MKSAFLRVRRISCNVRISGSRELTRYTIYGSLGVRMPLMFSVMWRKREERGDTASVREYPTVRWTSSGIGGMVRMTCTRGTRESSLGVLTGVGGSEFCA